jgi:CrcB protein
LRRWSKNSTAWEPSVDRSELRAIFLGGAAGTVLRAGLVEAFGDGGPGWPWLTFAVNVVGAFLLGYFVTWRGERPPLPTYRQPLLTTGFCGALTTFSTVQVELLGMLDADRYSMAAAYGIGSIVAGLLGVSLGSATVRRLRHGA